MDNYYIVYMKRFLSLIFGLSLYALGLVVAIQANIGLAPWDAFNIGVTMVTTITYGQISILAGIVIIFIAVLLKEKLGFGTILNTILIGIIADVILESNLIPLLDNFWLGVLMLLLGQVIISVASYFYIRAGLGAGPRDSLMIALGKRLPNVPIGFIRGGIEGTVLLIGFLLGAKVGVGTVIAAFGIGTILQNTFRLLHFDVKAVAHESVFDTCRNLSRHMSHSDDPSESDEAQNL